MKKILSLCVMTILFVIPVVTLGQSGEQPPRLQNPFGNEIDTVPEFLELVINSIVLPIGAIVIVIMIIWTGFKFVIAQGDPSKLKDARQMFLYTVIGALVLLGSWVIANSIKGTICLIYENPPAALDCDPN